MARLHRLHYVVLALLLGLSGCQQVSAPQVAQTASTQPTTRGVNLSPPTWVATVEATCHPPLGWKAEPLKKDDRHTHQVWLSPTGHTAYGVIHFWLPLPVGLEIVHWQFLETMRRREGEAIETTRTYDPALPGIRFNCEGGLYRMRVNLLVRRLQGWAVYAGTLRAFPTDNDELLLAEQAREFTVVGR